MVELERMVAAAGAEPSNVVSLKKPTQTRLGDLNGFNLQMYQTDTTTLTFMSF